MGGFPVSRDYRAPSLGVEGLFGESDRLPPMLSWFEQHQHPLYLAPMAGFTDVAFRGLCRRFGADVVVSEFVRAESLLSGAPRVWKEVDFTPEQRPMGVQIFGADPQLMADAARKVADRLAPDFIDINFGCPANPVTEGGAGSSCLRDLPRLQQIGAAVAKAVAPMPVTAKIRLGWDEQTIVAPEAARLLEDAGIQALAVHGRTRQQGYSGRANWDVIAEVVAAVSIPVIGNGDLRDARSIDELARPAGVRGLMVGRAALGRPWLFAELKAVLAGLPPPPPPGDAERWDIIIGYVRELLPRHPWGPQPEGIGGLRARIKAFTHGMPNSRPLRAAIERCPDLPALEALAAAHLAGNL